uniref:Protein kinase domain-containing protein n=1 Tax=viral metagenome TaxID=1070528 RepID=A0A6C0ITI4_9ZZZZ
MKLINQDKLINRNTNKRIIRKRHKTKKNNKSRSSSKKHLKTNNYALRKSLSFQEGGKVVTSGGFGCLFDPPLKCSNDDKVKQSSFTSIEPLSTNRRFVSKLMTAKNAQNEYDEIQMLNSLLQPIPNYMNYFLINDFSICKPSKLTNEDLDNFKKCSALKKKDITKENINKSLDTLLTLNMPYGGVSVEEYLLENFTNNNLILLNNSLIDLLVHGIIPMNKLGIYHGDIKDSNILIEPLETELSSKLIDWGLTFEYKMGQQGFPKKVFRRPFQFNVPFSVILFNTEFIKLYNEFLQKDGTNNSYKPDYYAIREFVINYIFTWNEIRGPGHLPAINDIMRKLELGELPAVSKSNVKDHIIEYDFTYYYIIEYITNILNEFTSDNNDFNILEYFEEVFLFNLDIWGFIMVYIAIFERIYDHNQNLTNSQLAFLNEIKFIFYHYLFENSTQRIDINKLTNSLNKLNVILEKMDTNDENL